MRGMKTASPPYLLPPLALTMGEPAGIGGEIAVGAWRALRDTGPAFFLIDDADRLSGVPIRRIAAPEEAAGSLRAGTAGAAPAARPAGGAGAAGSGQCAGRHRRDR